MARRRTTRSTSSGIGCGTIALLLVLCLGISAISNSGSKGADRAPTSVAALPTATSVAVAQAPTATPTARPTATPTPRLVPTPTAAAARTGRVSDPSGLCWVTLPPGFAEDAPGEAYFPADDQSAFVMLEGPLTLAAQGTPDAIAAAAKAWIAEALVGYAEINAAHTEDATHLAFEAATPKGDHGRGSILARRLDGQPCALIFFALDDDPTFEPTLGGLHATFGAATLVAPPVAVIPATATATATATPKGFFGTSTVGGPTPTRYPTSAPYPTSPPYVAPSTGGTDGGSGCGSRGGPGGPRTSSGKCPAWPKKR